MRAAQHCARSAVTLGSPPATATMRCFFRSAALMEVARADRSVSAPPVRTEEMPEQIGTGAEALQFGDLVGLDHAARNEKALAIDLTDADDQKRCLAREANTSAIPYCFISTARSATELANTGTGSRIGFRAGALGRGGESHRKGWRRIFGSVRQAATRTRIRRGRLRQLFDDGGEVRPWPTPITLSSPRSRIWRRKLAPSRASALSGRSPSPRSGATLTECEAEALGQCILQRDAFSDRPFDEDADHTLAAARAIRRWALVLWIFRRLATSDCVIPAAK